MLKEKIQKLALPVVTAGVTVVSAFPAFAAGEVVDANAIVTQAATSMQSDMMSTITTVSPLALTVIGAVIAIRFGVNFFCKLTGAKK